ncbi:hypothetical protein ABW21_db0205793 [Orbilia brochopaga]|nr:hypothetical protein ABW21_db0205793 [Drechslerella brochopaga]
MPVALATLLEEKGASLEAGDDEAGNAGGVCWQLPVSADGQPGPKQATTTTRRQQSGLVLGGAEAPITIRTYIITTTVLIALNLFSAAAWCASCYLERDTGKIFGLSAALAGGFMIFHAIVRVDPNLALESSGHACQAAGLR